MACIIFTAPIPKPGEVSCYQPDIAVTSLHTIGQNDLIPTDFCVQPNRSMYDDAGLSNVRDGKNHEPVPCTSFQFNTPFETTVTKLSLVCERDILVSTSQFFHLFGVLAGGIFATKILEQ